MKTLSSLLLTLLIFFLLSSPQSLAFASNSDLYKAANEFCSRRTDKNAREFCMRALQRPSPQRGVTGKETIALFYISLDLALKNTEKTRDFFLNLYKKKGSKPSVKECIDAYHSTMVDLKLIANDFKQGPVLATRDADLALRAMVSCNESLKMHNVTDGSILKRHTSSVAYVELCFEVLETVGK